MMQSLQPYGMMRYCTVEAVLFGRYGICGVGECGTLPPGIWTKHDVLDISLTLRQLQYLILL